MSDKYLEFLARILEFLARILDACVNTISGEKVRFHCSWDGLGQNSKVAPSPILENTCSNADFVLVFLSQRGLCGILRSVMGEFLGGHREFWRDVG